MLQWVPDYSVGVKELDEQHKKIIEIINRITKLIEENNYSDQDVQDIVKELSDYADYHFTNEEIYFREFDFEQTAAHIQEHEKYRNKMRSILADHTPERSKETLIELDDFINKWWVQHINHVDKEYTQCFHEHGLY